MIKCPYCSEQIQGEAIKCRFCGEFLTSEKPNIDKKQIEPSSTTKKADNKSSIIFLFLLLSVVISFVVLSWQDIKSFPIIPLALILFGVLGIFFSIKIINKRSLWRYAILAFCIPAFIISIYAFYNVIGSSSEYRTAHKAAQLDIAKKEADKKQEIQYLKEHREEYYQKGLAFFKNKKYQEASEMFAKVLIPDNNYRDAAALSDKCSEALSQIERNKRIAEAKKNLAKAETLLNSHSCDDFDTAIRYAVEARSLSIEPKRASDIVLGAQIKKLACFEGNNEVQMAIHILKYQPLTLQVSIFNASNSVRHANPNNFTLVTVSGRSYSVSSETYGLENYFDAVDLQPGTRTSGNIIFDTHEKPKKLVYNEMLGSTISREFPFD